MGGRFTWIRVIVVLTVLTVLAALVGCGSSHHANSGASAPPSLTGSAADAATASAVTAAFTSFFDGTASIAQRAASLQNAPVFQQALSADSGSPLIKQTSATVAQVNLLTPNRASVVYTISLSGLPLLQNQTGTALRINGSWVVAAATFCSILAVYSSAPADCSQAATTAYPS